MHRSGPWRGLYRAFWSLYGRYAWDEHRDTAQQLAPQRIVALLPPKRGAEDAWVLDAGCGTGNYALALATAGWCVVGVDYAQGMLARARSKVAAELTGRVSLQRADLNAPLPYPNARFDHALSISVLQAIADPSFALGELRRVLKPGGTLVLSLPQRDSPIMAQTVGETMRHRVCHLERRTPGRMLLVALKSLGDRYHSGWRWTVVEAEEMLRAAGFAPLLVNTQRQILVVAEKTTAG